MFFFVCLFCFCLFVCLFVFCFFFGGGHGGNLLICIVLHGSLGDFSCRAFFVQAKILCTSLCKCTGCKNFEESPERKTLMHLADAAGKVFQDLCYGSPLYAALAAKHNPRNA